MAFSIRPQTIKGALVFLLPSGEALVQSGSDPESFRLLRPAPGELWVMECSCEGFEYYRHCRHIDMWVEATVGKPPARPEPVVPEPRAPGHRVMVTAANGQLVAYSRFRTRRDAAIIRAARALGCEKRFTRVASCEAHGDAYYVQLATRHGEVSDPYTMREEIIP